MLEEIIEDNNCIVKAFENNPIAILQEDNANKKVYYFKASDIGRALGIVNIHSTIQNYEDVDERVIRKAYDVRGCEQDTSFLTSQGVYRLLYNSKKEVSKKFRKWAGSILDDIIFNESKELKRQLEEKDKELQIKEEHIQELQNKPETEGFIRKTGYIYIVEDISKQGHRKIGSCGSENVDKRLSQLNVGSSTNSLKITHKFRTFDVKFVEEMAHSALLPLKIRGRKEWFYVRNETDLTYIISTIHKCINFANNYNIKDSKHFNKIISVECRQYKEQIADAILNDNIVNDNDNHNDINDNIKTNKIPQSGYVGVTWISDKNKWKSSLGYKKKNYHLGYFEDTLDAAKFYNDYALYLNNTLKSNYKLNDIPGYKSIPRNIPEENKINNQNKKSSQYLGVQYVKERANYRASITVDGKTINISYGKTEIEAAKIYNQQALFYNITKKTNYKLNDLPDYITEPKDIKTENNNIKTAKKTSKYIGVMWNKFASGWRAHLVYNKTKLYLGLFNQELDAAKAYNQQALYLNIEKNTKYKLNNFGEHYTTVPHNLFNEKYKDKLI